MSPDLLLLVVGALVAGFVQGLSGFAFGMTAMSFWVWTLEPQMASVLVVFGSLVGQVVALFSVRRGLQMRQLAPYLVGGLLGVPIGVGILPSIDATLFRFAIGLVLVIWCPLMLFADRVPRLPIGGRAADALVGLAGGIMGGIGGFSGVVATLWCTLRQMPKDEQRAIIQNFNLAVLTLAMAAYLATGTITRAHLPNLAIVGVALLVPALLGTRVYAGLSQAAFRRIVLTLLSLSGLAMLLSSLLSSLPKA